MREAQLKKLELAIQLHGELLHTLQQRLEELTRLVSERLDDLSEDISIVKSEVRRQELDLRHAEDQLQELNFLDERVATLENAL